MFYQPDLFEKPRPAPATPDPAALIERISHVSRRPRYALLVLNLIAKAAGDNGSLGPYVMSGTGNIPVRDWLCQALAPLAYRDCRRLAMIEAVRAEVGSAGTGGEAAEDIERRLDEEVQARILRSGRTNVSRAVSDLVRAGLLRRHYKGFRVDHHNRGAGREAVYTIMPDVRQALTRSCM